MEESELFVERRQHFNDLLKHQKCFLFANWRDFAQPGDVLSEYFVPMGGADEWALRLVVIEEWDVLLRWQVLSPFKDFLSFLAPGKLVNSLIILIEVEEGASHSISEDGLDSNCGNDLPIFFVEITSPIFVAHQCNQVTIFRK